MNIKKALALILTLVMVLSLFAACGSGGDTKKGDEASAPVSQEVVDTPEDPTGDPEAMDVIYEFDHDGDATKITDAAFNDYFDGNAAAGVAALLEEGKIYVNGIQVPAAEDVTTDYQVNGVSSLYKTSSGWGFNVHKTTSADNLSFADARLGFYETITTVRGHNTVIYGDVSTGLVNKIDSTSYDVFRITYFEDHGGQVDKIDRGDFELETNRIRPDVNLITVASDKFADDIDIGDFVLYSYTGAGWVMQQADPIKGTLSKNEDGFFVTNSGEADEYVMIESNVSRYNLINCNRPTQFFNAYNALGLQEVVITMWCTPNGYPIGFSYGDKAEAKEALTFAIANATAAKDGVVVSADGSGVATGTAWVAQADLDAFDSAIAEVQAVCNSNSTAVHEYDAAIYDLANALGEGGEKPTGFIGAQGVGA